MPKQFEIVSEITILKLLHGVLVLMFDIGSIVCMGTAVGVN